VGFVQVIEFSTNRLGEMESLMEEWLKATEGTRKAHRAILGRDRETPDRYVQVVEFPSYAEAMENSAMPETAAFAERMTRLCASPPTFRNLDVVRVDEM